MDKFRILACDGGGIRGLLTAIWLRRLLAVQPDLLDKAGLFAGTSTGGIIALALAKGVAIQKIVDLYQCRGAAIFHRDYRHWLGLTGARYRNDVLWRELRGEVLGSACLRELRPVLIPSFQLDNRAPPPERRWKSKFWTNMTPEDGDTLAADVAMYTTAAPTYFPTVSGYVDGGLVANNPSMAAVAEVLRSGKAATEVCLLSLGTGAASSFIRQPDHDFGMLDVATLVDMMLSGAQEMVAFECRQVLGEQACRFNPTLLVARPIALDAVDRIPEMAALAESMDLRAAEDWLKQNW